MSVLKRGKASANPPTSAIVRISVPIGVGDHAKLCAAAALQQRDRSALAAEILSRALRGIAIVDRRKPSDTSEPDDEDIGGADAA